MFIGTDVAVVIFGAVSTTNKIPFPSIVLEKKWGENKMRYFITWTNKTPKISAWLDTNTGR